MLVSLLMALPIIFVYLYGRRGMHSSLTTSRIVVNIFMIVSTMIILVSICIVVSLAEAAFELFRHVGVGEFLFGTRWEPYGAQPSYGALPLIAGTVMVTTISIVVAVPIATLSALFITQFANKHFRGLLKQIFEIPASIPSVVYGYFGVFKIAPVVFAIASFLNLEVSYENAVTAGIAIAIMIAPIIFSITYDLVDATPKSWQYAALALGATRTELIFSLILPYISPGMISATFLAIARVIGETMIVVLVVGLRANITINPLAGVTTVTAQIVSLLNGDNNFQSLQVMAAYALGLALFVITFVLSMLAMYMDNKARRKYKALH